MHLTGVCNGLHHGNGDSLIRRRQDAALLGSRFRSGFSRLGFLVANGQPALFCLLPLTRLLMGTAIGVRGAIVPLVFGSVPFFTRQVESALAELDGGLIEAALSMGSSPLEIIFRVYLKESIAAIARGTTITIVSLLNLTAMAGVAGAGGIGDFAIRYGHDRNMADITNVTVLVLVLIVCVIEFVGGRIVKKNTH